MSAITQAVEVMADQHDGCIIVNNILFVVGDAVTYTVYPHVVNGLGMATMEGILSVGQTYMDVTAAGLGDICEWDAAYEVSHRE
jgi:hypothetical protein